jgi:lysyl endopeptidase
MIRSLLAWATLLASLLGGAHAAPEMPSREAPWRDSAAVAFRMPGLAALQSFTLAAPPLEKSAATEERPGGRLAVGTVRGLPKAEPVRQWLHAGDGFVARFDAASQGAAGLRVKLEVAAIDAPIEVRVQGADSRVELMTVEPGRGEAWTPWTEGAVQAIEIFSRAAQPVSVGAIVHFTESPLAKATAGTCTVPTMCTTNDAALDAAIAQRKKSLIKINFVEGGASYVCSATLVNTDRFPAPYVLTANHCVGTAEAAASVTSFWFYEQSACDSSIAVITSPPQVAGGTQLVFTNANVDSSLLLMARNPPAGALYSGWSAAGVPTGAPTVSLSHPQGDTARLALGSVVGLLRIVGKPQDMYGVRFSRGIIQGGSSGSGLFTLAGGSLQLRGILSGTTIRQAGGMSCTNLNEDALYGRMDILHPQIDPFIRVSGPAADDAPNRVQDMPADTGAEGPLNLRATPVEYNSRRIDYAGDLDLYRFVLTAPAVVSAWTEGPNLDTVGSILDSRGRDIDANDDEQAANNHFGLTRHLDAGTYYVQVGHFEPAGTGTYNLRIRADSVDAENRTALWWNASERGWGLNVNHQGNTLFATLFTYDASGPTWLVMSKGDRQPDGSFQGPLLRMSGPPFNAVPFGGTTFAVVGTMRLAFMGSNAATLSYSINGVQVTKSLTRQEFRTLASCSWSAFDRSYTANLQDLWFNPAEPGWGVNFTQQGDILFATLFTYDASGRPLWLVMSEGIRTSNGFSGTLYRMSGPVFNASPWTAATHTAVGTMTVAVTHGNSARLTYSYNGTSVSKQIQRQVFGTLKPSCE